jgi:hypothetical protein
LPPWTIQRTQADRLLLRDVQDTLILVPTISFGSETDDPQSNPTSGAVTSSPLSFATAPEVRKRTPAEIRDAIAHLHLATDGDGNEQQYWPAINEHFPNYEFFWRDLVVPMTRRIDLPIGSPSRHERREHIADDLRSVSYINYSVFLNLVGAFEHLTQPLSLSLGSFYTHIASACELAEEFLLRVHRLISECLGERTPELEPLSKEEFLKQLDGWYDREYAKAYEHYHKKGKEMIVRVSPREKILCKYFERQNQAWQDYKRFRQPIREYRNKVVHDVQLGTVRVGRINLMPRTNKILEYTSMPAIQNALNNPEMLKRDFVVREEQMFSDFRVCKERLNALWEKPTLDLSGLLYEQWNPVLLGKYNLSPT